MFRFSTPPPSRRFPSAGSTLQIPVRRVYLHPVGTMPPMGPRMGHDPDTPTAQGDGRGGRPSFFAKQAQNIHVRRAVHLSLRTGSNVPPRDRTGGRGLGRGGRDIPTSEALA